MERIGAAAPVDAAAAPELAALAALDLAALAALDLADAAGDMEPVDCAPLAVGVAAAEAPESLSSPAVMTSGKLFK